MSNMTVHYYGYGIDPPWDDDYHPSSNNDSNFTLGLLLIVLIAGIIFYNASKND